MRTEPFYVIGTALVFYPQLGRFHHTGPTPTGLIVKQTRTQKAAGKNGKNRTITLEEKVEDLSDSPLNPSLFELPSGFHENPDLFKTK